MPPYFTHTYPPLPNRPPSTKSYIAESSRGVSPHKSSLRALLKLHTKGRENDNAATNRSNLPS